MGNGSSTVYQRTFPFVEGKKTINMEEVIYIETNRHKNIFHMKDESYSIYRKIGELQEELKGLGFMRTHQSFLVNMRYVQKISSYVLTLTTGEELSVPKARYQDVKQEYAAFVEEYKEAAE